MSKVTFPATNETNSKCVSYNVGVPETAPHSEAHRCLFGKSNPHRILDRDGGKEFKFAL